MRRTFLGISKSIVGTAFIGVGLFILYWNVTDAAAGLSHMLGLNAGTTQAFGELTVAGLAASQALQCFLFDRAGFVRGIGEMLILLWPLLLVVTGTVLLGMASESA